MSGLATLLDRARAAGRAAGAGGADPARMGAAVVVLTLATLAIHLRRAAPPAERTVELAADALALLAVLLAGETGMTIDRAFDSLVVQSAAADLPAVGPDLAAARGHVLSAVDRAFDLGHAVLEAGPGTSQRLTDLAGLAAGHVLVAALAAGAVSSEPRPVSRPERALRAAAAPR